MANIQRETLLSMQLTCHGRSLTSGEIGTRRMLSHANQTKCYRACNASWRRPLRFTSLEAKSDDVFWIRVACARNTEHINMLWMAITSWRPGCCSSGDRGWVLIRKYSGRWRCDDNKYQRYLYSLVLIFKCMKFCVRPCHILFLYSLGVLVVESTNESTKSKSRQKNKHSTQEI